MVTCVRPSLAYPPAPASQSFSFAVVTVVVRLELELLSLRTPALCCDVLGDVLGAVRRHARTLACFFVLLLLQSGSAAGFDDDRTIMTTAAAAQRKTTTIVTTMTHPSIGMPDSARVTILTPPSHYRRRSSAVLASQRSARHACGRHREATAGSVA